MSTKGKNRKKAVIEKKNKDAARKFTMIVVISTVAIMLLMYMMYSDGY